MRKQTILLAAIAFLLAAGSVLIYSLSAPRAAGAPSQQAIQTTPVPPQVIQVTQPPTPDESKPGGPWPLLTSVPLASPVEKPDQALSLVMAYDAQRATWQVPWYKQGAMISSESNRVTIEHFANIDEEATAHHIKQWIDPRIVEAAGPVWAIQITGKVTIAEPGPEAGITYTSVTYILSAKTGEIVAFRGDLLPNVTTP